MIRTSQAFAAFRSSLIAELQNDLQSKLLPSYNACVFDIQKEFDTATKAASEMESENAQKKLVELAEKNRHARILELAVKRRDFIQSLTLDLKMQQHEKLKEYEATVEDAEEERNGKVRKFQQAVFKDGSRAKIAAELWVNFADFQRV